MKVNSSIIVIALSFLLFVSCSQSQRNERQRKESQIIRSDNKIGIALESILQEPIENSVAQILNKKQIPVLCYHRIEAGRNDVYSVSPEEFESHLKVLSDSGYNSVLPDQLYDYLKHNAILPNKPFMITFDDSRLEHITIAAPALAKHNFKGAFFIMMVTNNKKNYLTRDEIVQLTKEGHTVGLHSWDHVMVTKYTDTTIWKQQMIDPQRKLVDIIGKPVDYWAYPNGVYDRKAAEELDKHFKLSFILMSKRDSIYPLQTIRRMIAPPVSPDKLIKSMKTNFN